MNTAAAPEQLELDLGNWTLSVGLPRPADHSARLYWENQGPHLWEPVKVRVRYGPGCGDQTTVLPEVRTGKAAPRNVLIERADGTTDVRPVRVLRVKQPR